VVYHVGSVSSDLVWTEHQRLRRCHQGGVAAYEALHGRWGALLYRLSEVLGATVRWAVYRLGAIVRPSDYYAQQALFYRALIGFYAAPVRSRDDQGDA
jgi:hypothetical protein